MSLSHERSNKPSSSPVSQTTARKIYWTPQDDAVLRMVIRRTWVSPDGALEIAFPARSTATAHKCGHLTSPGAGLKGCGLANNAVPRTVTDPVNNIGILTSHTPNANRDTRAEVLLTRTEQDPPQASVPQQSSSESSTCRSSAKNGSIQTRSRDPTHA